MADRYSPVSAFNPDSKKEGKLSPLHGRRPEGEIPTFPTKAQLSHVWGTWKPYQVSLHEVRVLHCAAFAWVLILIVYLQHRKQDAHKTKVGKAWADGPSDNQLEDQDGDDKPRYKVVKQSGFSSKKLDYQERKKAFEKLKTTLKNADKDGDG